MTHDAILSQIRETATMLLGPTMGDLQADTDLRSSGLDSLDIVEVVTVIESTFEVKLEDAALKEVKTAGELADVIARAMPVA